MKMTKYTKERIEDLLNWLQVHDISCTSPKLHRKFSDGVILANLLKKFYPRLIDLHNYSPQSSIRLKLSNWETLNAKVLSKVGLTQSKTALENLAKGEKQAIETLLLNIMKSEREKKKNERMMEDSNNNDHLLLSENQKLTITINKKIGDALVQVPQEMVLYSLYESVVQDIDKKTEIINKMKTRADYIEADIEKLRSRIRDLMEKEENAIAAKMANMKFDSLTGLLDSGPSHQNNLSRFSSTQPNLIRYKEPIPPNCTETSSLSSKTEEPNTITTQISTSLGKSEYAVSSPIITNNNNKNNNKNAKTTKIPTRNGQALKSLREKYLRRQHYKSLPSRPGMNENTIGIKERSNNYFLPIKNLQWSASNISQNMNAEYIDSMNTPTNDFRNSSSDNINRILANIKSSESKSKTETPLVGLENIKFKRNEKYDLTNLLMGSFNTLAYEQTVKNNLLPLTHQSESSILKSEVRVNSLSYSPSTNDLKNVLDRNVEDCVPSYENLNADAHLSPKIIENDLCTPDYDSKLYVPRR